MLYSQYSIMSLTGAKMKAGIHPEYKEIKVTCSCGHVFTVGSALGKDLHIEVCNECHPFYTGKQKIVDTAGRVERFKGKFGSFMAKRSENSDESKGDNKEASKAHAATGKSSTSASMKPAAKKDSGAAEKKAEKSKGKSEDKKQDKKK